MNRSNFHLWLIGAVLLYIGWIVFDMSRPGALSSGTSQISAVRTAKVPVLLEFYADWCPPCRKVGPMVDELSRELKGKAVVIRINVDEEPTLARDHGVQGIPLFLAYKNGREIGREVGGIPKERMRSLLGL